MQTFSRVSSPYNVTNSRRKRGFSGRTVESPRANPEARNYAESKRSYGVVTSPLTPHPCLLPQDSREGGEGRNPGISNSIFGTTVHAEWSPDPADPGGRMKKARVARPRLENVWDYVREKKGRLRRIAYRADGRRLLQSQLRLCTRVPYALRPAARPFLLFLRVNVRGGREW